MTLIFITSFESYDVQYDKRRGATQKIRGRFGEVSVEEGGGGGKKTFKKSKVSKDKKKKKKKK